MSINFQGKLTLDKSFYSLKQSNCKEIEDIVRKVYDTPKLTDIIPDTVIFGKGSKKGDQVLIRFGKNWDIPIVTRGEVRAGCVLQQILLNTCFYHGEQPLCSSFKYVKESLIKILKRNHG
ncbi:hypothetical protein IJ425_00555 [bacterium]|nr:hypothetical protein [bacterium]